MQCPRCITASARRINASYAFAQVSHTTCAMTNMKVNAGIATLLTTYTHTLEIVVPRINVVLILNQPTQRHTAVAV